MSNRTSSSVIKVLRHTPALFSIIVACVMIYHGGFNAKTQIRYYILNYLFVFGIYTHVFLEYWLTDVKDYRFRRFSLWAAAFISLSIISTSSMLAFLILLVLSPVLSIVLVVFSFIGKQPRIIEGRFYPAIFSLLSTFWALDFIAAVG
jgi:hypothetical protein